MDKLDKDMIEVLINCLNQPNNATNSFRKLLEDHFNYTITTYISDNGVKTNKKVIVFNDQNFDCSITTNNKHEVRQFIETCDGIVLLDTKLGAIIEIPKNCIKISGTTREMNGVEYKQAQYDISTNKHKVIYSIDESLKHKAHSEALSRFSKIAFDKLNL